MSVHRVAALMGGAKPKTDSVNTFGERVSLHQSEHASPSVGVHLQSCNSSLFSMVTPPQRPRQPTSSVTRSWTSKGRRKATAGGTRTPGSSATNSESVLPDLRSSVLSPDFALCDCWLRLRLSGTFIAGTCCAPTSRPPRASESSREGWPLSQWLVTAPLWTAGTLLLQSFHRL